MRNHLGYASAMAETSYPLFFIGLSIVSLVFFLGSLAALPWLVGRLPEEYFLFTGRKGSGNVAAYLFRNFTGAAVFFMGVLMLFTPGQGVLTIVAGLVIMEFPGKSRLIRYLTGFQKVREGLNWLRRKKGKPPLKFPGGES